MPPTANPRILRLCSALAALDRSSSVLRSINKASAAGPANDSPNAKITTDISRRGLAMTKGIVMKPKVAIRFPMTI